MTLAELLTPMLEQHRGDVSVAVKHLGTGEGFQYKADRPMPTASLIKLPLMVDAYRAVAAAEAKLEDRIVLKADDQVPGSGVLTTHMSPGTELSLRDAIRLMIAFSDNTATNLVIDKVGLAGTTKLMGSLGLPNTRLHSKVYRGDTSVDVERSREFGLGSTTAAEMVELLELMQARKLVSPEACDAMLEHLFANEDRTTCPRDLPPGTRMAHKTGAVSASRTDAGIIESPAGPIAICVLTNNNADRSWENDNEPAVLMGQIARTVYDYFNKSGDLSAPPVARVLAVGTDGLLVEYLQRTLNARVTPNPELGVDGDFGPNTERVVKLFQTQAGLKPTGLVDAATWKALGPLLTQDEPVDAPQAVNNAELERQPADPIAGPPTVSCAAYAVVDAGDGAVLHELEGELVREPASITKIMTALLVVERAAQEPALIDETITVSQRAAATPGSSASLNAGDQVPVGELLYGLMLPSGNDASVALGEHLGLQMITDLADKTQDPLEPFLEAMNARAKELGMIGTVYKNTHGLPAEGHVTTARDMARLTVAALRLPLFRKISAARRRGATLSSIDGYQRNVVWSNTNQLLGIAGFDGVKTGTTDRAGACLVASGDRGGRALVVVILGADSSGSRYVDARNLFRYAWGQLGVE